MTAKDKSNQEHAANESDDRAKKSDQDAGSAAADSSDASLKEQLEAAREERDANKNNWLRAEAELENYRKRARKEIEELQKYRPLELTRDLLPVLDNLDRAILASEGTGNVEDLLQGIRMVAQQFRETLARHKIESISAKGEAFDPNLHEAVQQIPTGEHDPMTVLEELESGYKLHDRVIRPSKVVVAAELPKPTDDEDSSN